mgnify:FL=1
MGKVIGYVRVSTEEQAREGFSIGAQQNAITEYCQKVQDLAEPEFLIDDGYTGKNTNRPALQELLRLVDEKQVEHLVVIDCSRLSRSLGDFVNLLDRKFVGVGFHSVRETFDSTTPMGKAMMRIIGVIANLESDLISARTREGMAEKKRRGERIGRAPFGFLEQAGPLVLDMEKIETVKYIFQLRGWGARYQQIANQLNKEEIKAPHGKQWYSSTIGIICRNRATYAGFLQESL